MPVLASENDLLNKRLKLDYEEITPCLKEVTTVWEKMLSTPGRSKIKFDMEKMHSAVGQGKLSWESVPPPSPLVNDWEEVQNENILEARFQWPSPIYHVFTSPVSRCLR